MGFAPACIVLVSCVTVWSLPRDAHFLYHLSRRADIDWLLDTAKSLGQDVSYDAVVSVVCRSKQQPAAHGSAARRLISG